MRKQSGLYRKLTVARQRQLQRCNGRCLFKPGMNRAVMAKHDWCGNSRGNLEEKFQTYESESR